MKAPVVRVRNVSTRFGEYLVHDDISFDIYEGEIFGLLGPSGYGKSTMMREMILLQEPDSGSIEVLGKEVWKLGEKEAVELRKQWGVVFQESALFSSLSVEENIALLLREYTNMSPSLIRRVVATKLEMVGLSQSDGRKYPSELSGGMKKKAALARALAMDPKLLFLDEPTSSLDPVSAAEFDSLILSLRELLGLTIVIVTHDLASIRKTLDTMVLFADKKVIARGTLQDVLKTRHPIIESFFLQ
ncbi:MAG: ATP-binding cassette domain-containing protein [Campylobacterales bacterium]|nr:ATP-binding cassette domain-containing protein [Campylobacterales bacterium]